MKNILVFVGVILVAVGIIVYFAIGMSSGTITVNGVPSHSPGLRSVLQFSIGGFLAGLGALFIIGGLRAGARAAKEKELHLHLMQSGIETEGTVTFVDKNYSILVNKNPIYSILEYTYKDNFGKQHINRIPNLSSEQVIRKQIQVGTKLRIKYAREDSAKSTISNWASINPPASV
jgi:hypothetical protein